MGTLGQVEAGTWWIQTDPTLTVIEVGAPVYLASVDVGFSGEYRKEHEKLIRTVSIAAKVFHTALKPLSPPEVGQFWEDDLNLVYRIYEVDHNTVCAQDVECSAGCKIQKPIHSWMRYFHPHIPTSWERL